MPLRALALAIVLLPAVFLSACGVQQRTFDTPEAAITALHAAVEADDRGSLRALFGPRSDELRSGDPEQDRSDFIAFSSKITERTALEAPGENARVLLIGEEAWPFPVPLIRENSRWRFDTEGGIEELANRRIGENELATIAALRAFVAAERAYQSIPRAADGVREYTARLLSTPGERDGLFWETADNEDPPPLGPVMALAVSRSSGEGVGSEGGGGEPYYGYLFKALTRQGPAAPGGAMDYAENGRLTRGIAAVAFPAEYGRTGIMTFTIGMEGTVFQSDLGPDTASIVAAMTSFDPGQGWTKAEE